MEPMLNVKLVLVGAAPPAAEKPGAAPGVLPAVGPGDGAVVQGSKVEVASAYRPSLAAPVHPESLAADPHHNRSADPAMGSGASTCRRIPCTAGHSGNCV